jgi:hypothetical protein
MRRYIAVLVCSWFATARLCAAEPELILPMKVFSDTGNTVHVEGTLAGDGLGYPNNTAGLTCYRARRECLQVTIDTEGRLVFPVHPPIELAVRLWTDDRIIAEDGSPCGAPPANPAFAKDWQASESSTWIIDRKRETAELTYHPCNEARTYHWTIEDSPYWRREKERAKKPD